MFKRLYFILVIAVVASSAQVVNEENLEDPVDDILKKLEQVVDAAVDIARKELIAAEDFVNKTAEIVEAEAKSALNDLQKSFQKDLDELKAKAKKAGVDIESCLGEDEKKLINLPISTAHDIELCIRNFVLTATGYVNEALIQLQKYVDDVDAIKEEIKKCGTGLKAVTCLAKVAAKIEKEIVSLPLQIIDETQKVIHSIESLYPNIKQCGSSAVTNCALQGEALLTKISLCVAGKIIH